MSAYSGFTNCSWSIALSTLFFTFLEFGCKDFESLDFKE